jgi:dihydrofolate synthase/folylpolyglutamate synthase
VTATEWIESLTPWPAQFGLERMRSLLTELGEPQRRFPSVHVVGTNGKSTATRRIEALLAREGLRTGAYLSPHVRSWAERIRTGGVEADFEHAVAQIRPTAERLGATQFEALTAAAFKAFAEAEVDAAVVEAGLGGRLDATNVVDAPVVLLTNVSREHTEVLGETPQQIAKEKLAVAHAARVVVLSDDTYAQLVPDGARLVVGGAHEAAEAFLGRPLSHEDGVEVALPGRLEHRSDRELWDGAHNAAGAEWLAERLPPGRERTVVASILRDKDAEAMLRALARRADRLVATASSNPRSLPAADLARLARPYFEHVVAVPNPCHAVELARGLGPPVLVTGSLYLLADLHGVRSHAVP